LATVSEHLRHYNPVAQPALLKPPLKLSDRMGLDLKIFSGKDARMKTRTRSAHWQCVWRWLSGGGLSTNDFQPVKQLDVEAKRNLPYTAI
jgi:hypothetical protein